jgi:hypothetical protein
MFAASRLKSHMSTKLNSLSSLLVVVLSVAGLGLAAPAGAAPADPGRAQAETVHTWGSSTVCVESHVGAEWDVRGAIRRWNHLDGGPTFVLHSSCADYVGTVTVHYESINNRFTGWSKWYWNAKGDLVHADVTVNPLRIRAFASENQSCQRKHTITHEFGHALGLRHYPRSHAGSVMSYLGWQRLCGGLTAHDASDYHKLYPVPAAE